jgi:glutaredoxin
MGSGSPPSLGPGRRCAKHALAAGPDGLCALCRSESLLPSRAYPTWVLGGILLAILLVSGGAVAYRTVTSLAHATIAQEAPVRAAAGVEGDVPARALAVDAPIDEPRRAVGDSRPLAEPATAPEPLPFAAPEAFAPAEIAPAEVAASPRKPPPSEGELRAALSATPIVMYSATWCGVCRKAKQFLSENGLRYREIDADLTPGAWEKIEQLIGHRGVPVIIVDGELTPAGLSPPSIMRAVSHSLERRLGVQGIRVKTN